MNQSKDSTLTDEIYQSVSRYTLKHQKKISEICEPLATNLGITYFTYYFIEKDGSFGTLTNSGNLIDYYYSEHLYIKNPYMSHPDLFRSGYVITPCSFEEEEQKALNEKYMFDHLFLMLNNSEKKAEGFLFADKNLKPEGVSHYIEHLDLLIKFGSYFKREADSLIKGLKSEQFNIQKARQQSFLEIDPSLPLAAGDQNVKRFLKDIYGLSPQEERCLELFKKGNSAQSSAAILGISNRTVEYYFDSIKNKLRCKSKWDLLNY